MMKNKNNYERHSTYVRNMYSPGFSAILISFFKLNLSFLFQPFLETDRNGRSVYGKRGIVTTVTYEGAAALYIIAHGILFGKVAAQEVVLTIPCAGGASLVFERKPGQNGQMETFLMVTKNNDSIVFKFNTDQYKCIKNNQVVVETIETGLGVFYKILDSYLMATNASGHLNKLGDDLEALQDEWQHMKEQQAHNAAGNNNQGNSNGHQFGNNITYQASPNNNQPYVRNQYINTSFPGDTP